MADTTVATAALLNGVPPVNSAENLRVALDDGRRMSAILREIVTPDSDTIHFRADLPVIRPAVALIFIGFAIRY